MFPARQRRAFASGAAWNQKINTATNLPPDKLSQRSLIE